MTTRERILDAARRLFNEKGYAATTLAEIAASIGIAPGNLTYHFPAKRQLVAELHTRMLQAVREQQERHRAGPVTDDYVDLLLFSMNHAFEHRFLLRDHAQFAAELPTLPLAREIEGDVDALRGLLVRARSDGLFRRDMEADLGVLARSLWIVSRYWMDHLRDVEGVQDATWSHFARGIEHHFAVLLPYLTPSARRDFETSLERASSPTARGSQSPTG